MATGSIPPLPAGFTMDQAPAQTSASVPPLPAGFTLDQPQQSAVAPQAHNEISAHQGGIRGWLDDLQGDLKYGSENTIVGRVLKKMGAQPLNNGVSEGAADMMGSPVLGAARAAHGSVDLADGTVHAEGGKMWRGTKDVVGGTLDALQIPGAFVAPEAGEVAQAGGEAIERGAGVVKDLPSRIKRFYSIPETAKTAISDYEKAAPGLQTASEAAPAAADIATAAESAKSVNQAATKQLHGKLHGELEKAAKGASQEIADALGLSADEIKIPTSGKLSDNADRIGKTYRTSAQQIYKVMDEIAGGTHFQDLSNAVEEARTAARKTGITDGERQILFEKLNDAETKLKDFTEAAAKENVNLRKLKGVSDKLWSKGMSFDEIAWRVSKGENLAGELKPSSRPLDTTVRDLSTEASNRGHVLRNALGEGSAKDVVNHTVEAANTATRRMSEISAAKSRIAQTKTTAAEATAKLRGLERGANEAKRTVDKVHARRWKTAGAVLGGGGVVKAASALYGSDNK